MFGHSLQKHRIPGAYIKQPEYSLCSSVGQPPCSLCAQKPLFAGMLVPGSVVKLKIIPEQNRSAERAPGGCRSLF